MDTYIRCHVKNKERLATLEREFISWNDKGMSQLGDLYVIDDNSPMGADVKILCRDYWIKSLIPAGGEPDTKNGLYQSLKASREISGNNESLFCVDDAVFGVGIVDRLVKYSMKEHYIIPNRGLVGLFACYESPTRTPNMVHDTDLWVVPIEILYALVAHIFSVNLRNTLIWEWEQIQAGKLPYPNCCDDLWVKGVCWKHRLNCYNTMQDYAQHTGGDNRTFGESTANSRYKTKMFVGE